jgi:septal ring factor EnvC (AmiA/AmiB activator)
MTCWRRWCVCAATALLGASGSAQQIDATRSAIEETRREIQRKTEEKKQYDAQRERTTREVRDIDRKLKSLEQDAQELMRKRGVVEQQLAEIQRDLDLVTSDIEFLRSFLSVAASRLVGRHLLKKSMYADRFMERLQIIAVNEQASLLRSAQWRQRFAVQLKQAFDDRHRELARYTRELEEKRASQRRLFVAKGALVAELRSKSRKAAEEIERLRRTQQELTALLKRLEERMRRRRLEEERRRREEAAKERRTPGTPPARKSTPPAVGRTFSQPFSGEVVTRFGREQVGADGTSIMHNGVTIQGMSDADVRSIAGGTVMFVSNDFRSYGRMVILEHDGDIVSVYGQLGAIMVAEGMTVSEGQVIGRSGGDGQVYIELRKELVPVDPVAHFRR